MSREHGTLACYHRGRCRCDECRWAVARYEKRRIHEQRHGQPRSVDSTGMIRRVHALAAMGWSIENQSKRLGWKPATLGMLVMKATRSGSLYRSTAEKIAALYDELSMLRGPSKITASRAKAKGWAPPLAWDDIDNDVRPNLGGRESSRTSVDPIVVERILDGDYSLAAKATRAEREQVVAQWRALGRKVRTLEAETGWQPDRYRTPADVRRIIERSLAS